LGEGKKIGFFFEKKKKKKGGVGGGGGGGVPGPVLSTGMEL